jgi:phosphoglycerate dehydrogenase-like enzyme
MPTIVSLLEPDKFNSAQPEIPAGWTVRFLEHIADQEIIKACSGADCLFSATTAGPISGFVLENIPSIKIVQTMGVGFDHVDITAAPRLNIPVANNPGANATSVAEHTIGVMIALQRRLFETDSAIKAGIYSEFRNQILRDGLQEIRDSRIGLVGFGDIGRQVARIASLLGASVSYHARRRQPPEVELQYPVEYKSLDLLLSTSDIVSLHAPLNAETRGLIGARELELMPPGSILINTARGELLDQAALAAMLEKGRIAGAALDTLAPEPPGPHHPLLNLSESAAKRLLLTAHTAGVTVGAYKRMLQNAMANMVRAVRGDVPQNIVNGILKR